MGKVLHILLLLVTTAQIKGYTNCGDVVSVYRNASCCSGGNLSTVVNGVTLLSTKNKVCQDLFVSDKKMFYQLNYINAKSIRITPSNDKDFRSLQNIKFPNDVTYIEIGTPMFFENGTAYHSINEQILVNDKQLHTYTVLDLQNSRFGIPNISQTGIPDDDPAKVHENTDCLDHGRYVRPVCFDERKKTRINIDMINDNTVEDFNDELHIPANNQTKYNLLNSQFPASLDTLIIADGISMSLCVPGLWDKTTNVKKVVLSNRFSISKMCFPPSVEEIYIASSFVSISADWFTAHKLPNLKSLRIRAGPRTFNNVSWPPKLHTLHIDYCQVPIYNNVDKSSLLPNTITKLVLGGSNSYTYDPPKQDTQIIPNSVADLTLLDGFNLTLATHPPLGNVRTLHVKRGADEEKLWRPHICSPLCMKHVIDCFKSNDEEEYTYLYDDHNHNCYRRAGYGATHLIKDELEAGLISECTPGCQMPCEVHPDTFHRTTPTPSKQDCANAVIECEQDYANAGKSPSLAKVACHDAKQLGYYYKTTGDQVERVDMWDKCMIGCHMEWDHQPQDKLIRDHNSLPAKEHLVLEKHKNFKDIFPQLIHYIVDEKAYGTVKQESIDDTSDSSNGFPPSLKTLILGGNRRDYPLYSDELIELDIHGLHNLTTLKIGLANVKLTPTLPMPAVTTLALMHNYNFDETTDSLASSFPNVDSLEISGVITENEAGTCQLPGALQKLKLHSYKHLQRYNWDQLNTLVELELAYAGTSYTSRDNGSRERNVDAITGNIYSGDGWCQNLRPNTATMLFEMNPYKLSTNDLKKLPNSLVKLSFVHRNTTLVPDWSRISGSSGKFRRNSICVTPNGLTISQSTDLSSLTHLKEITGLVITDYGSNPGDVKWPPMLEKIQFTDQAYFTEFTNIFTHPTEHLSPLPSTVKDVRFHFPNFSPNRNTTGTNSEKSLVEGILINAKQNIETLYVHNASPGLRNSSLVIQLGNLSKLTRLKHLQLGEKCSNELLGHIPEEPYMTERSRCYIPEDNIPMMKESLPISLESLSMHGLYAVSIKDISNYYNLESITIGAYGGDLIDAKWPSSLKILQIEKFDSQSIEKLSGLPTNLDILDLGKDIILGRDITIKELDNTRAKKLFIGGDVMDLLLNSNQLQLLPNIQEIYLFDFDEIRGRNQEVTALRKC